MKKIEMLNKKIFLSMVLLLSLVLISGCGSDDTKSNEKTDDGIIEDSEGANTNATAEFDNWFNPENYMEVIEKFEKFEYTGSYGNMGSTIHYQHGGTEIIQGVETEKVTVYERFIYWVDGEGNVVQAAHQFDNNLYPEDELQDITSHLNSIVDPFKTSTAAFNQLENPKSALANESNETMDGKDVTIITYETDNGVVNFLYEVVDFGEIQLLYSYEVNPREGSSVHNRFENVILR